MNHLDGIDLVYFVQADLPEPLIKIGSTTTFPQRWSRMRAANAVRLTALGVQVTPNAKRVEHTLHRRFADDLDHARWYRRTPEILHYIATRTTKPTITRSTDEADEFVASLDLGALLNTSPELPRLLTIEQVARALGVAPATVRRRVAARSIPYVRVGGQFRFDLRDVRRAS
jgi:excisionase family DNA binding protein